MTINYNLNIPAGANNPSADRPLMTINTNAVDSLLAVDHYNFNLSSSTPGGFHKHVHLINEAAPGLSSADAAMYANIVNGQSWPIWQNALGSTVIISSPTTATPLNGTTSLAGGILLKWGKVSPLVSDSNILVSFSPAFPTACFVVTTTLINAGNTTNAQTLSVGKTINASGFFYNYTGGTAYNGFYWVALGN